MKKISRENYYGPGIEKMLLDCRSPSAVAVAVPVPPPVSSPVVTQPAAATTSRGAQLQSLEPTDQ